MKKIFLLISILGLLLVSCERDKEVNIRSLEVLWEILAPSYNSIDVEVALAFSGIYESYCFREAYVQYATSQDFTDYQSVEMQWSWDNSCYKVCIEDLTPNTTYYARYHVKTYSSSAMTREISEFKTLQPSVPTVIISNVSNVSHHSAMIHGEVTSDGGSIVSERGVVYSTSQNPTTADIKVTSGSGTGSFSCNLTGLQEKTTYYVRAYAMNSKGTAYGEEVCFTTEMVVLPTVMTTAVTKITATTAMTGGNVTSDGGASVTERGVVYSTVSNPVINNLYHTTIMSGTGTGSFSVNLANLVEGTIYYIRAYAVNSKGTAYGEQISFKATSKGMENGYDWVDLGLSVKWATMNVGATKPEDCGGYFAWGETQPKYNFDWSNYSLCSGSYSTLTKYNNNSSYGIVDNKTTLELNDDAAHANWAGSWRMPTKNEQDELRNNCTWTWINRNGVNGYEVTSKSNENSIFLPATGYYKGWHLYRKGDLVYYLSSSLLPPDGAHVLFFEWNRVAEGNTFRYYGNPIRPVCP